MVQTYWCVMTTVKDDGNCHGVITEHKDAEECPESTMTSTRRADIWCDWFDSREKAVAFIKEGENA